MRGRGVLACTLVVAISTTACARRADPPTVVASGPTPVELPTTEPPPPPPTATASTTTTTVPGNTVPATAPPQTTTTTGQPAAPAEPRSIGLAFVGDILPHSPLWRGAQRIAAADGREGYDFDPMFADLRPLLARSDLAVCHLETPIAPEGERFTTSPRYGVPPDVVDGIASAGFGHCSTASNHTLDRGVAGIDRTIEVLESRGLTQSGMARTPEEIWPRIIDVDGVAVALLSYTWSYNGLRAPRDAEWRSALIDPDRIALDATTARLLGAEVVVVSLHWGAEQITEPTRYQREIAEALTATGEIDLIVGHHAHVLQPIEQINGTWVMFGLGNILSNLPASPSWTAASQDAAVALVTIVLVDGEPVRVERPELHPTWVDKQAERTIRVVADHLARDDLGDRQRALLEASWGRSIAVIGEFVPPLDNGAATP